MDGKKPGPKHRTGKTREIDPKHTRGHEAYKEAGKKGGQKAKGFIPTPRSKGIKAP
ncbi:MAG: hypothetical protein M1335_04255 [Chloroflexi bacterium]|nr:hypothetical protein [Chloroflexota bacterium]